MDTFLEAVKRRRLDFFVRLRLFGHHVLKGYVSEGEWTLGEGDTLRLETGGGRMKKGAE